MFDSKLKGSKKRAGKSPYARAGPTDYRSYKYTLAAFLIQYLKFFLLSCFILYLFYQSSLVILFSLIFSIYLAMNQRKRLCENRKWQLNLQFKDAMAAVAAALEAGYSVENAFGEAIGDIKMIYGPKSYIVKEFEIIAQKISVNIPLEESLRDFAERSGVEDIENFSEVFCGARRSGGDFIKVIRHTSQNISGKIEVKREILTMMTGKRLEAKIMTLIPSGIILYLLVFSPGYLDPLYGSPIGAAFMSLMLLLYAGAYLMTEKIMDIHV